MNNVELIDYTHEAITLLLRTKNTRLGAGAEDPANWTKEARAKNLNYMRETIKSSFEFVNFTFRIHKLSRSAAQQLERHRHASFAEQSLRAVDVRDAGWKPAPKGAPELYDVTQRQSFNAYTLLQEKGMALQDAREVLPLGTLTSLIAQFNLRSMHEAAQIRLCVRTQGELQNLFREMKTRILEVYPEFEPFIRVGCALDGVCRFPNYTGCPIQKHTFNSYPGYKAQVAKIAEEADKLFHEAVPVAKSGKTM